ncbi:leucyl/phenylalanyl-tRNA--protein transferase [Tessaracoccus flavescens]|uniref:Leucyl/phenylalanyl-tRNA--protein transferase n=1 Tax=Tessaracoccus flavescens TaxID=399497 RepID=A0A1Q2CWS2_9ACTN|nr:leucyl/phenylalanyl-tRNA--protein transferase [Tessaracoccus flavescens]AQP50524.1 leucyl/phenylalanyl-tRNA--protein transferase [Tessaracoccus flavescens]
MLSSLFGRPEDWPQRDLIGYSDEFDAALALEAYRCGVFPMPMNDREMGWWSPMDRGLLPVHGLRVTRSLRKLAKRYTTTTDTAFDDVIVRCAEPSRDGAWIDTRIAAAYRRLAAAGWAHSVEVWDDDGELVGGLYGIQVGGLFAGESMFHDPERGRDASKTALIRLALELDATGVALLDVQWLTEHLGSLGAYEVPRADYLRRLSRALDLPNRAWPAREPMPGRDLIGAWSAMQARHDAIGRIG